MNKKNLFLVIPLIMTALCSLFFLTSLDNKVYDLFLRTTPSLTEDPSVLIITIDDGAIENVGVFPWIRDILADAIVFLREMDAAMVAFDLNYIDNSPVQVDGAYVREDLPRYLEDGFRRLDEGIAAAIDGFAGGRFEVQDAGDQKENLKTLSRIVRNELGVSIDYVSRDVDAYFADTLEFFGNSWLTLTMVTRGDILGEEKTYAMDPAIQSWLEKHIALKNTVSNNDARTPEEPGVIPAIYKLLSRSRGAGFVNATPDADGYRRRVHLLMKHNKQYYGQLTFAAMQEMLGNPQIEVSNSAIILKGAVIKGSPRDMRIPRAEDGSLLLNWPRKSFYDYNIMSSWDLIKYNRLEAAFASNLANMSESGFFGYWDGDGNPWEKYNNANYVKELLYSGEENETGVTFDTYLDFRRQYLDTAAAFLDGPYEGMILADYGSDPEIAEYVGRLFDVSRKQFRDLLAIREDVYARTAGAFCIIGVAATSMTDEGLITYEERYPNVGTYAVIANQILSGEFLDDAPRWISLLFALVLSFAAGFSIKHLGTGNSILAGLGFMVITVAAPLLYFIANRQYIGVVVPFASVTLTFLTLTGLNFLLALREKSFLRSAFSRYLAPEVINQIIADPSKLQLGGQNLVMTALFTDIRGFSTISEKLSAPALVELLNMYLTEMSNIILENRGTIDKYEGDAIIAFFGAPVRYEDHAARACRSAIQMKRAEAAFNKQLREKKLEIEQLSQRYKEKYEPGMDWHTLTGNVFTRIGINTGDMVVGNMGTPSKMDYTVMGNAVNIAARLEGVNKQYNTRGILISEYTREMLGDEFILRSLDRVQVAGITAPFRIYELLDLKAASGAASRVCSAWEEAIQAYENRQFAKALALFRSISDQDPADNVAKLYIARCVRFKTTPPPENWDGVYGFTKE
jgi:adenylate cyclase